MSTNSEYKKFIEKFFPYSGSVNNDSIELIYLRVCENNLYTDIYEKYIKISGLSCHINFLQTYKLQFNKLLLYVPLNEKSGIEFCVRSMIEQLLKFLYSIYFNKPEDKIKKLSFRHLKEEFKNLHTDIFIETDKIELLFNHYGFFSNYIHNKKERYNFDLEYMESIVKSSDMDLKSLDDKLLDILKIYETLMNNILKINKRTLSSAEVIRLSKSLSTKRNLKVEEYMYKAM